MEDTIYKETLPNGFAFDMILVKGGEFYMGGNDKNAYDWEKPVHRVKLDTYYVGKFPVTQALWKAVMGEKHNPSSLKGDQRPVENVSWEDIVNNFLPELNRLTASSRTQNKEYRLPTEAEWEYAARGGIYKNSYQYAGSNKLKEVGWYDENSYNETKPVGLKDPNELGLHDMSGNVWEWCADWYIDQYYKDCHRKGTIVNPLGPNSGIYRVMRGGSSFYGALNCRVSYRRHNGPDVGGFVGFRIVLSPHSVD